jgi:hypothetical protein
MYNDGYSIMQNSIRLIGLQLSLLKSSAANKPTAETGRSWNPNAGKPNPFYPKNTIPAQAKPKAPSKPKVNVEADENDVAGYKGYENKK